jgi:hypothetical protein
MNRFKSFFAGFASAFDITGGSSGRPYSSRGFERDREAFAADKEDRRVGIASIVEIFTFIAFIVGLASFGAIVLCAYLHQSVVVPAILGGVSIVAVFLGRR